MPQIGEFTREESGFTGRIHTLTLYREITILPVEPSEVENAPNYRVHHGADDNAPEIGAAWTETSEKAGACCPFCGKEPATSTGLPPSATVFAMVFPYCV